MRRAKISAIIRIKKVVSERENVICRAAIVQLTKRILGKRILSIVEKNLFDSEIYNWNHTVHDIVSKNYNKLTD